MRSLLFVVTLLTLLTSIPAEAMHSGTILQVTRKVKLTSTEPDSPRDFVIDLGTNQEVKVGDTVVVSRWIPIQDSTTDDPKDFLRVTLGEIQVNFIGANSCIGRMTTHVEAKDLPTMDNPWFMVGDAVQLKSSLPFKP
jgi:hypothetical protein